MESNRICITADCSCDLPHSMIRDNNVELMYYYIRTDEGIFREGDEITAVNIFDYHSKHPQKPTISVEPTPEEFRDFFRQRLQEFEQVIHLSVSDKVSTGYQNACAATRLLEDEGLGGRVSVLDSQHLSTGLGHLVLHAVKLLRNGADAGEIYSALLEYRSRISTTFMADSADYLYRSGKVNKSAMTLCSFFNVHPVLEMRNGEIRLKSVIVGSYGFAAQRYVNSRLRRLKGVCDDLLFITHAGCTTADVRLIRECAEKRGFFKSVVVTSASATISCNSGPRTFGLLFVNKPS